MNLDSRHFGYAVMNKNLDAISLDGDQIEPLKRYCRGDDVIAERIPVVCGLSIKIWWFNNWYKPFYFGYSMKNILWLHWSTSKEYRHKTGRIVWNAQSSTAICP